MRSKLDQLRCLWENGDGLGALRIASKFFDRSPETRTFQRGHQAVIHPDFFRQVGKEPAALIDEALDTLARKFKLP